MCDWEEFLFVCHHSALRLKSYCHFARNDPNHQCYGVKVLRQTWLQDGQLCDDCLARGRRISPHDGGAVVYLSSQQSQSQGQGQGQQRRRR